MPCERLLNRVWPGGGCRGLIRLAMVTAPILSPYGQIRSLPHPNWQRRHGQEILGLEFWTVSKTVSKGA
jgi:hypothetical protein